jgi:hypothetical protein
MGTYGPGAALLPAIFETRFLAGTYVDSLESA